MTDRIATLLAMGDPETGDPAEFKRLCAEALGITPQEPHLSTQVVYLREDGVHENWDPLGDHNHAAELVALAMERNPYVFAETLAAVVKNNDDERWPSPRLRPVLYGMLMGLKVSALEKSVAALVTLEGG